MLIERHSPPNRCEFAGNPEIYGLGIRLGLYFQWFSSLMTGFCEPSTSSDVFYGYVIFGIAIFFATITADPADTHAIDIVILLYMFSGGFYTTASGIQASNSISSIWARHRGHTQQATTHQATTQQAIQYSFMFPGERHMLSLPIYNLLMIGMLFYSCWFWSTGVQSNFIMEDCGTWIFLFARAKLSSSHRSRGQIFMLAVSVFITVPVTSVLLIALFQIFTKLVRHICNRNRKHRDDSNMNISTTKSFWIYSITKILRNAQESTISESNNPREVEGLEAKIRAKVVRDYGSLRNFSEFVQSVPIAIGCISWTILGIELMLYWNNVTGVNEISSVGQIIAFVIGLTSLLEISLQALLRHLKASLESCRSKEKPKKKDQGVQLEDMMNTTSEQEEGKASIQPTRPT